MEKLINKMYLDKRISLKAATEILTYWSNRRK